MGRNYQEITDTILSMVDEAGEWKPSWTVASGGLPSNAETKAAYRGINTLLLWVQQINKGYASPQWATFKTWTRLERSVRKGEKASHVFFFDAYTKDEDGEEKKRIVLKHYPVFNLAQVDGGPLPVEQVVHDHERIAKAEAVIKATGASIYHDGSPPHYKPKLDTIHMPDLNLFKSPDSYYATMFHELGHWTGAKSRLDRELTTRFKTEAYAMEELVAELTAAFVCGSLSIAAESRADHAAYLQGWRKVLQKDNSAIVTAASAAQKAADFILNTQPKEQALAA